VRWLGWGVPAVLLGWGVGFLWSLHATARMVADELPARADGIIALTGGSGRVERALRLLAEGRGERLLISGVGRAEFAELARRAGVSVALAPRVTLGREATSTRGNALEAADWARANHVRTAIVVTSAYHMPRALLELSRTLEGVRLWAAPVWPVAEDEPARLRLVAGEFTKFLAAACGLTRAGLREEPAR
jgi:uncharacterized SAM-binding protein YcdF (DUF218 family)